MKQTIWLMLLMCISGCATVPLCSFSPYTTADGEEKWRLAVKGYSEDAIQPLIESAVGKNHICQNGWVITNRHPSEGFEIIEGKCKK